MTAVSVDSTDRKRIELRESELWFRELAEQIRILPWEADAKSWRFKYVGPQSVEILGYPRQDWYQADFWTSHIHPEDKERILEYCAKASATKEHYEFEYRMLSADGNEVWIHDIVNVVRDADGPRLLRGYMIDITERKQAEEALRFSEQRYRMLVETMNEGVGVQDEHGVAIYVNDKFCELLGYPRKEIVGRPVTAFIGESNRRLWEELMSNRRREKTAIHELDLRRKDGTAVHLAVSTQRTFNENGEFAGSFAILTDVTDRRRAEKQARLHQAELAHVARLSTMGEMASGLAHELNQPLCAIATYSKVSLRIVRAGGKSSEKLIHALEQTAAEAKRAGEIIRRIRDFVPKESPQKTYVDLNALVREAVGFIEAEAREKGITLQWELAEHLPCIWADRIQIEQVLLNLLRNGIEAMSHAGTEGHSLTLRTYEYGAETVHVTVKDTGPGLDTEQISRIFDPFYTSKADGIGMGLSISFSIIDAHGGRLWAEPAPGPAQGATFHFTLPVTAECFPDESRAHGVRGG